MIKTLGGDVTALTFGGAGSTADAYGALTFSELLKLEGLTVESVETKCGVRTNVMLIDPDGEGTEINESGGPITEAEYEAMLGKYDELIGTQVDCVLLAGSIPQGVEKNVYNLLTKRANAFGVRVALDCDGGVFQQAMRGALSDPAEKPWLVKPNAHELFEYLTAAGNGKYSTEFSTSPQVLEASRDFYAQTGVNVLCTAGGKGAVFVGKDGEFTVSTPKIEVKGFAGAGDCFLGAFVYEYTRTGGDIVSALKCASGAGAAKTATAGTEMPPRELICELASNVEVARVG